MCHNRLQLKSRIISVCLVIPLAALAIASISLAVYTPGFAAPALNLASAGAIKVYGPLKEVCLVPANSQTALSSLNSNSPGSCTVSTSTSSPALGAPKSSSAVDPLSFSVATLESMRWRNTASNTARTGSENPLSSSVAALESMRWRNTVSNAAQSSSENPLSINAATLESMRLRHANQSQFQGPR
jgi:hypothetical protein